MSILLATASNDQRVKLWELRVDLSIPGVEGLSVKKRGNKHTSVSDISSMDVFIEDGEAKLVICGVGMELWNLGVRKV